MGVTTRVKRWTCCKSRSKESWSRRFNGASELVSYSFDLPPSYSFCLELVWCLRWKLNFEFLKLRKPMQTTKTPTNNVTFRTNFWIYHSDSSLFFPKRRHFKDQFIVEPPNGTTKWHNSPGRIHLANCCCCAQRVSFPGLGGPESLGSHGGLDGVLMDFLGGRCWRKLGDLRYSNPNQGRF